MALFAQQLQEKGCEVLIINGDYYNIVNDSSIRDWYKKHKVAYRTFEKEYERLHEKDEPADMEYLRYFEGKYCVTKNLNQLVMTDPILASWHHYRFPYYTKTSKDTIYRWTAKLLKWLEDIIFSFNPDAIFSYERAYLIKNAAAQISLSTNLPMRTLVRSRIGNYWHLSSIFGCGSDETIEKYLNLERNPEEIESARQYVMEYKKRSKKSGGLYAARSQELIKTGSLLTPLGILRSARKRIFKLFVRLIKGSKKNYRRNYFLGNYFDSYAPAQVLYFLRLAYNQLHYIMSGGFIREIPQERFIYYPLHTLPESSTLTLSTEYYEADLIRFISKELPVDITLAVKENPNMVGERPWGFYKEIQKLPNVKLIDPTVSSFKLLSESMGVTGISGTALLEGALIGKAVHAFGIPEFIDVIEFRGKEQLSSFLKQASMQNQSKETKKRALSYVQFIMDNGMEFTVNIFTPKPGDEEVKLLEILTKKFLGSLLTYEDVGDDKTTRIK